MAGMVIEGPLADLREREVRLLTDAADYIGGLTEGSDDKARLLESAADLREMFLMVVIIGEFNAGKSTFVNALLGDALLPMGITPTTDAIELIRYAALKQPAPRLRGDAIREWFHPNTGGPGVVIVDTPGTGSVFAKHEQIAKNFLHRSDLVIFVISAKRAFAETERLYLDLARGYGKKIIIVINQADLLEGRESQDVHNFVERQADELLDLRPPIFMVSAKRALNKDGSMASSLARGDWGMDFVRNHLRGVFEQVPPAKQKLLTQLSLLRTLAARYRVTLQSQLSATTGDTAQAEDIQRGLDAQGKEIDRQLTATLSEIRTILEGTRKRGERFIDERLRITGAFRGLDREKLRAEFEAQVVAGSVSKLQTLSEGYVSAVVDGSRAYWRGVIERLNKIDAALQAGSLDATAYADQRAALQNALSTANTQLQAVSGTSVLQEMQNTFAQNARGFTISVGAVISGLVAFLLSAATGISAVHGLTILFGVIFAPVALVGGGIGAAVYYNRVTRDAKAQLESSMTTLEGSYRTALTDLTARERTRLLQYGQQILAPVFSQLQAVSSRYRDQQTRLEGYFKQADALEAEVNALELPPEVVVVAPNAVV